MASPAIPPGFKLVPDDQGGPPEGRGRAMAMQTFLARGGGLVKNRKGVEVYASGPMKGMTQAQAEADFETKWSSVGGAVKDKYARKAGPDGVMAPSEKEQYQTVATPAMPATNSLTDRRMGAASPQDMDPAAVQKRRMAQYGHEFAPDGTVRRIGEQERQTVATPAFDKDTNGIPDMIQRPDANPVVNKSPLANNQSTAVVDSSPLANQNASAVIDSNPLANQNASAVTNASPLASNAATAVADSNPLANQNAVAVSNTNALANNNSVAVGNASPLANQNATAVGNSSPLANKNATAVGDKSPMANPNARHADRQIANITPVPRENFAPGANVTAPASGFQAVGEANPDGTSKSGAMSAQQRFEQNRFGNGGVAGKFFKGIAESRKPIPGAPPASGFPTARPPVAAPAPFPVGSRAANIAAGGQLSADDRMAAEGKTNAGGVPIVKAPKTQPGTTPSISPIPPMIMRPEVRSREMVPDTLRRPDEATDGSPVVARPADVNGQRMDPAIAGNAGNKVRINSLTGLPFGYNPGDALPASADAAMQQRGRDSQTRQSVAAAGAPPPRATVVTPAPRPTALQQSAINRPRTVTTGVEGAANREMKRQAGINANPSTVNPDDPRKFFTGRTLPLDQLVKRQTVSTPARR